MVQFQGVFSVIPTPFTLDGEIDSRSLERVVDLFIAAGVNGLTALGVTSEVSRLSERERTLVLETVVKRAAGKVPVVAGASAEGTRMCIDFAKSARSSGAMAVMVSPPRMPKLNSEAVLRHYKALAEAVDLPIVIQDYPPISGFTMEPDLLVRIAREVPTARTIKLEDPPTPLKTSRIMEEAREIRVRILGGLGGVYLLEELIAGTVGTMTGFAYPEILVGVVRSFQSGNVDEAADMFYRFVSLMRFEFQESIGMAIRKEMLRRRGVFEHAVMRAPGAMLNQATMSALDRLLAYYRKKERVEWISA